MPLLNLKFLNRTPWDQGQWHILALRTLHSGTRASGTSLPSEPYTLAWDQGQWYILAL